MLSKSRIVVAFLLICSAILLLLNYVVYSSYKQERISNLTHRAEDVLQLLINIKLESSANNIPEMQKGRASPAK